MSLRRTNSRNATATSTIMIGPPANSARVNCQDSSSAMMMPRSMTRLVLAISKVIAAVKLAPRRNSAQAGGHRQRLRLVAAEQPGHGLPPDHRLDHRRQRESQDQRPGDLPRHR